MLRSVAPACLISGLHRSRRGQPPVRVPYLFELVCRLYPYQRLQPDKNGRIPLHLILTLRRRLSSSLGDRVRVRVRHFRTVLQNRKEEGGNRVSSILVL